MNRLREKCGKPPYLYLWIWTNFIVACIKNGFIRTILYSVKIIFTSSVAIYGFAPANTDESGKPNYFNDYGRSKYLAEKIYKDWYYEDEKNRTLVINGSNVTSKTFTVSLDPSDGKVLIGGQDMSGIGPNKRPTSLIFQNLLKRQEL